MFQELGLAGEVAHQATGLGHQQGARCHVPGLQAALEKSVAVAGGHIGQVQGRSARAADAGGAWHQLAQHGQGALEIVAGSKGQAGGDQAGLEFGALGDAQAPVVQKSASAFGGGKQIVARRVVDHGLLDLAPYRQRNAHAIHGQAVDEVGGAVQWVDDPDEFGVFGAVRRARFFSPYAVAGVGA